MINSISYTLPHHRTLADPSTLDAGMLLEEKMKPAATMVPASW